MEPKRTQFTFYFSFVDALQHLTIEQRGEVIWAIALYAMLGELPELDGPSMCSFKLIRPVLDAAEKKAASGKAGKGATHGETKAKQKQTKTETKTRAKRNENESKTNAKRTTNEKEKEKEKENEIEIENECYARAEEVVRMYERFCPGLVRCEILSAGTKKAIADRFREHGDLAVFERLFRLAGNSDFLNGRKGSWRASLDWLMEERNFAKVLNGVYDNRPDPRAIPKGASGELGAAELEAIQRVLREEP